MCALSTSPPMPVAMAPSPIGPIVIAVAVIGRWRVVIAWRRSVSGSRAAIAGRRAAIAGRRSDITGRRTSDDGPRSTRRDAAFDDVAVVAVERDVAPLVLAVVHIDGRARRNERHDGEGRAGSVAQIDVAVRHGHRRRW